MAVQWDKENGLNGWGVDFWNTIRGIKKDLPAVDAEIKKFITSISEDYNGVNSEHMEHVRPQLIQDAEELSGVTDELKNEFAKFLETADLSGDIMEQWQNHIVKSSNKTSRFSKFAEKAGAVLKSFGASLASMGVNMAIGIGFEALISLFNNIANSAKYAKESSEEFVNSVDSVQSAFAEGSSKIEELDQKYKELSSGVNEVGENVSLTNTQYDEYKSVVKQISDLMPNLTTQINSQGEAIGFVGGKLDSVTAKYKKYRQAQAVKFITEGDDEGKTYGDVVDAYNKSEQTEKGKKKLLRAMD